MKTRITELLKIKHPIVQSGMNFVANPAMVAATCNAGGLGLLPSMTSSPDKLRQQIHEIKQAVGDKPFGVNITPLRPAFKQYLQVILDEHVPVVSSGLRDPFKLAGVKKPESVFYIPTVGSVDVATRVAKGGADAVIAQGWEAGGHGSEIASMVLTPEVVDAVKVPVISAGGFCDGKGLAAALALGAEGIAMGTRFAVSQESSLPKHIKEKYLEALDRDALRNVLWDGLPSRSIVGEKMRHYRGWWTHFWELWPGVFETKRELGATWAEMWEVAKFNRMMRGSQPQLVVGMYTFRKTIAGRDFRRGRSPSGQVVGRIEDIPTCREIIERTVLQAEQIIKSLPAKVLV